MSYATLIGDTTASAWLTTIATSGLYLSLHTEIPDLANPLVSEVHSQAYVRQLAAMTVIDLRSLQNVDPERWLQLPECSLVFIGGFDAPTNGNFVIGAPIAGDPVQIPNGAAYSLGEGEFFVSF